MAQALSPLAASLRAAGFRGEILVEEPLSSHTTWRIGGPAELLAAPEDREDLVGALGWAGAARVPWRVLGNGSNLLVGDAGVRGLVLRVRKGIAGAEVLGSKIRAGGGASFPSTANLAAASGLSGIEFGAGIPGTIGGAVLMNAGWHEFEIGNAVESVEVLDQGGIRSVPAIDCGFGYRRSAFRRRAVVVLEATLALARDDPAAVRARLEAFAASRKANQPTDLPSCGSVFLKPEGDFAGRLIEQAGLKGARAGDIEVSRKHANFFVNLGRGTAGDVLALVERVEREVETRFGVSLVREFEVW